MGQVCRKPQKTVDDKKERKKRSSDDAAGDEEGGTKRKSSKKIDEDKKDNDGNTSVNTDSGKQARTESDLEALVAGRRPEVRPPSLTDEEKQSLLKGAAQSIMPAAVIESVRSAASLKREAKRNAHEHTTLSARLEEIRHAYEQDKSVVRGARARLAEIERAHQLIDHETSRYESFIQDIFHLTARSGAHTLALRAETLYEKLHGAEVERLEEANVDLLAETVVYYDVLPRVYCDARREILRLNQALIGTKKQQLFWHQSRLLHYEGLVEKQERRIDNVIVMARYLQDHASDQGYLLWAERFRKLRDMARYIDSLRFETDDLRSELSYLADLNRVQLEEFGAKRLGSMLQSSDAKLVKLRDALRQHRRRRVNESVMRSACQALASSVYAPRELPTIQLEFLDSQIEVCVKLAKLFALVSDNQRLRLQTRNAQMLAKIVSLCRKHNVPPTVWREIIARTRANLAGEGLASMLGPAWATFTVYDSQVRRAAAVAATTSSGDAGAVVSHPLRQPHPGQQTSGLLRPTNAALPARVPPTVSFANLLDLARTSLDAQKPVKAQADAA